MEDVSALMAADPKLDKLIKSTAKMLLCIQQVSWSTALYCATVRTLARPALAATVGVCLSACRGKRLPRPKAKSARQ